MLSTALLTFGVVLLLCSWVYMLTVSFKDDFSWGLTTLFLPPLSYLYGLFALEKSAGAMGLAIIGCFLIYLGL